jgi:hypothetical protein
VLSDQVGEWFDGPSVEQDLMDNRGN